MQRSESIAALSAALATAQGGIRAASKDSANPFYHTKYADLASIWDACRHALSANGVAVMQFPRTIEAGIEVETILSHASGEWVSEIIRLPAIQIVKNKEGKEFERFDAQTIGSAITYARRYALAAMVGVAPDDDDDGNAAAKSSQDRAQSNFDRAMAILRPAAAKGITDLEVAWKSISNDMRAACKNELPKLKEAAAKIGEEQNAPTPA